jgi:N-6 DNA Methylase
VPAEPALAGLARTLAGRRGPSGPLFDAEAADGFPVPPDGSGADLLGLAHEALLGTADRKARGAHYTPAELADRLVALTLDGLDGDPRHWRIADLAAGGGAFLLAAGRAVVDRGLAPAEAARALHGVDVDPLAAQVASASVSLWSGTEPTIVCGDGLVAQANEGFDAVVGNPPFQSQLRVTTARSTRGGLARGYADTAGLFLARACEAVRTHGRVGLIQPQSVLAARDAAGVRAAVQQHAALRALWVAQQAVFAAGTRVVAVIAERGGTPTRVALYTGPEVVTAGSAEPPGSETWAPMAARASGVPAVDLRSEPTIGSLATATAGFRPQFYGLAGHVREDGPGPRLVTAGLIDPLRCRWGERPTRFAGRTWQRPTVDLDGLDPELRRWFEARRVPKLLVATQTRVIEALVDEVGTLLPSVPVISVEAPADRLWDLAAALLAPPVSAWALARVLGTGLSSDAVRLSARLVLQIPLPSDAGAWAEAADALRRHELIEYGRLACRAYGADPVVADWWAARLPRALPVVRDGG